VDPTTGGVSVADMLEQTIGEVERDARTLGCLAEVEHCRTIAGSGTSADAQLEVFKHANGREDNRRAALRAVTDWIAEATLR
jgi:carboxylate-amine ligase